jgi:hypothetical protein
MPYQYGMQNSPSGGNGLGGLPKKQTTPKQVNFTRIVTAGSGVIVPPANAKYMRVAVVGAGGTGYAVNGGAGGGCAATKIVPASPIQYTVGAAALFNGASSTASFTGYTLVGGGGGGYTSGNIVGVGSGGDYNYNGGAGVGSRGGGAAGPSGNGGDANQNAPAVGPGWGCGGGGGGSASGGQGGGGSGANGAFYSGNYTYSYFSGQSFFGGQAFDSFGGQMGGGGGAGGGAGMTAGGVGGIVVEWFYD